MSVAVRPGTKSQRDAQDAADKMGAVIVPIGNGGFTLMPRKVKARLLPEDKELLDQIFADVPVQSGDKKRATSGRKALRELATAAQQVAEAATPAAEVVESPAVTKKPYNPAPLAGAPAAGKAPQKGQLPLGLLRMLVKRNPNSETLKAALAAAESQKPAEKARAGRKGSKK